MSKRVLALLLSFFLARHSAAELLAPYDLENTDFVPAGLFSPRFLGVTGSLSSLYDTNGGNIGAAARLNRTVTWNDVIEAQDNEIQKASVRSLLMVGRPIATDDRAGEIVAQATSRTTASVPILLYGATPRLTLGIAVPVLHLDAQVDAGFVKSEHAQEVIDRACGASSPVECSRAAARLNRAVEQRLEHLGYEPLRPRELTAIGDIRLIAKYSLLATTSDSIAIKPIVYLPTGKAPSPDDILGLKTGDGRVGLALTTIYERQNVFGLIHGLKFDAYSGYYAQLPDQPELRVPTADGAHSADKERVARGITHAANLGASLLYAVPGAGLGINVGAGYHFQYQWETHLSGNRFSDARYAQLGALYPSRALHSSTFFLGLTTYDWYRRKIFFAPLELKFTYNRPLGGRNAWSDPILAGEMIVYL